ncbi:hypothetical protein AB0D30_36875, partial [Streptomyces sp. NPDC048409]|uniref:hypothetical protein n=1 Tax=Streptomyces sp. NPDC048409 TaxID=3154723 RepID=UPI003419F1FF
MSEMVAGNIRPARDTASLAASFWHPRLRGCLQFALARIASSFEFRLRNSIPALAPEFRIALAQFVLYAARQRCNAAAQQFRVA